MTPEQADLVRHSFDGMWPVHRKFAATFYRHFFELVPDARRLFPDELMDMIAAIVGALDQRELFQSIIRQTGRQHASFGVTPSHYLAFRDALIASLEEQFGAEFTPALRQAWLALYEAVRGEMIKAAQGLA